MLQLLIEKDTQLFLYLNGGGETDWDFFWLLMSEKWMGAPLLFVFLFVSYKQLGPKKTGISLLFIAALILCTDQLANFFKYGVARPRPCYEPNLLGMVRLVKANCGGAYGFFSAHAANTMAVAVFSSLLIGKGLRTYVLAAVVLALLVGYSRIYLGVHYPLDVLFGFGIGGFLAFIFARLYKRSVL